MKEEAYIRHDLEDLRKSSREAVYASLGCFDKALYFLVRQNIEETEYFFIHNLYPVYYKRMEADEWYCFFEEKNCMEQYASCFQVVDLFVSSMEDFKQLEDKLRKGHTIIISGDFRRIPYFLNNVEGLWGVYHTVLLAGYDIESLFFYDNLTVIMPQVKQNRLSKVRKEELLKVFQEDYRIRDVSFLKAELLDHEKAVMVFLSDMIEAATMKKGIEKGKEEIVYLTGLIVFKQILLELKTKKKTVNNRFFTDYHIVHEIIIYRNLLQMCLEGCRCARPKEALCRALAECSGKWEYMKMQIMRNHMKPIKGYQKIMINCMEQVIGLEANLVVQMNSFMNATQKEDAIW